MFDDKQIWYLDNKKALTFLKNTRVACYVECMGHALSYDVSVTKKALTEAIKNVHLGTSHKLVIRGKRFDSEKEPTEVVLEFLSMDDALNLDRVVNFYNIEIIQ